MLTPLLFAAMFGYCPTNPIYDSPGGSVVKFYPSVEMVKIVRNRGDGWVEVLTHDGRGKRIDKGFSYWMRMNGCWGPQVGV